MGASSCGRLAKRARCIVPLHVRGERSAGWKPFQDKPALQIGAEAAAVGERAGRVARWMQVHVVALRRGHDISCSYTRGRDAKGARHEGRSHVACAPTFLEAKNRDGRHGNDRGMAGSVVWGGENDFARVSIRQSRRGNMRRTIRTILAVMLAGMCCLLGAPFATFTAQGKQAPPGPDTSKPVEQSAGQRTGRN